jgi:hypothetical protein
LIGIVFIAEFATSRWAVITGWPSPAQMPISGGNRVRDGYSLVDGYMLMCRNPVVDVGQSTSTEVNMVAQYLSEFFGCFFPIAVITHYITPLVSSFICTFYTRSVSNHCGLKAAIDISSYDDKVIPSIDFHGRPRAFRDPFRNHFEMVFCRAYRLLPKSHQSVGPLTLEYGAAHRQFSRYDKP